MKKLFIATCLLLPGLVYSAATPLPSGFDARMQTVSYNGANTTVIRSKTGFLTSVVLMKVRRLSVQRLVFLPDGKSQPMIMLFTSIRVPLFRNRKAMKAKN